MPQMAPIWWTTLFLMFIMAYIMFMITVYFFISYSSKNEMKKMNKNNSYLTWMW